MVILFDCCLNVEMLSCYDWEISMVLQIQI